MNLSSSTCLGAALTIAASALAPAAEMPASKPLASYAELWTASRITAALAAGPADDDEQRPPRRVPVARPGTPEREIAELRLRVTQLEAEVAALREQVNERSDGNGKPAPKDGGAPDEATDAPPRLSPQRAVSNLEALASREAQRGGLEVKRRKVLPTVEGEGAHSARVEHEVSGREEDVYRWLHLVHSPRDFRGVTGLRIVPTRDDDTKVDVRATIEQWFLPADQPDAKPTPAQLRPLTEPAHFPLELLLHLSKATPPGAVRFEFVEIMNQLDADGRVERMIRVMGKAEKLNEVTSFTHKLKESEPLREYNWNFPPPVENAKTGQWQFVYDGSFADGR